MTGYSEGLSCLRLPYLGLKGYLNMGLPDRASCSANPILLHDQVEVRVVLLSLGDVPLSLLVSADGMLVFRWDGMNTIRAGRAVLTAGSDVSLSNFSLLPDALVFCWVFCASSRHLVC